MVSSESRHLAPPPLVPMLSEQEAYHYDVNDIGLIVHLMEQLFVVLPHDQRATIMWNLHTYATDRGLTQLDVSKLRLTWYAKNETHTFPQEPSPEPTSAEDSTRSPSMQGSGSSDDTVDPAALGQRTTGLNLDTVD